MTSLLPAQEGLLPYWLLLVSSFQNAIPSRKLPSINRNISQTSATSILNTITCYTSKDFIHLTYQGPAASTEVTSLSTPLFGTWMLLSSVIHTYAAYNLDDKGIYAIALSTYAIALAHFSSEWLGYKTMSMGKGLATPFAVASLTTFWMLSQSGYYIKV